MVLFQLRINTTVRLTGTLIASLDHELLKHAAYTKVSVSQNQLLLLLLLLYCQGALVRAGLLGEGTMPTQHEPGTAASPSVGSQGKAQPREKQQVMAGTEYTSLHSGSWLFI